jgi:hypothetical protein
MQKGDFQSPTPRRYLDTRRQGAVGRSGREERQARNRRGRSETGSQSQVEDHGSVGGSADGDRQAGAQDHGHGVEDADG